MPNWYKTIEKTVNTKAVKTHLLKKLKERHKIQKAQGSSEGEIGVNKMQISFAKEQRSLNSTQINSRKQPSRAAKKKIISYDESSDSPRSENESTPENDNDSEEKNESAQENHKNNIDTYEIPVPFYVKKVQYDNILREVLCKPYLLLSSAEREQCRWAMQMNNPRKWNRKIPKMGESSMITKNQKDWVLSCQ